MSKKADANRKQAELEERQALSRREFLKKGVVAGVGAAALTGLGTTVAREASSADVEWDYEVDVLVIGAGAFGLPAAIRARDLGSTVLVIDQNFDPGGRMLHSGGWVSLGGGDPVQERDRTGAIDPGFVEADPVVEPDALEDDVELLFRDMTDWSVVDPAGVARYRYNDRELHRAWAENAPATRQFMMDNYVRFARINGTHFGGGVSRARAATTILRLGEVTDIRAGTVSQDDAGRTGMHSSAYAPIVMLDVSARAADGVVGNGGALARPLEFAAREKGARFMLNRRLEEVIREEPFSGRVMGVRASYSPRFNPDSGQRLESFWQEGNIDERRESITIRARQAVIIGTGGHSGNPEFRKMFYPAMSEELFVTSGWSLLGPGRAADASGIIAGMKVGANLAGMQQNYNYPLTAHIQSRIGTRDAYTGMLPGHPTFPFRQSTGVSIGLSGFEHLIAVNQVGKRFYSETDLPRQTGMPRWPGGPGFGTPNTWRDHVVGDWRNCSVDWIRENFSRHSGLDAALQINEGSRAPDYTSGPIWAIFDQEAVERAGWNIDYPYTANDGFFHKADTIEELAHKVMNHPFTTMPLIHLADTVERWNAFVDAGQDEDFERDGDLHPIAAPPFYAAAIMVIWHDSYGGLRINGRAQVVDLEGQVIPGLYSGGEASGGGEMHGLGRAHVHGYIAGTYAVREERVAARRSLAQTIGV